MSSPNTPAEHVITPAQFYEHARIAHKANQPQLSEIIELGGNIAIAREVALEMASDVKSPDFVLRETAENREELRADAQILAGRCSSKKLLELSPLVLTRLSLYDIFVDQMVLAPALFSYPPDDEQARSARVMIQEDTFEDTREIAIRLSRQADTSVKANRSSRGEAVREATMLSLVCRAQDPDSLLVPAAFAHVDQAAQTEYFTYDSHGELGYAAVRTTQIETTGPDDLTYVSARQLGVQPHAFPWGMMRSGGAIIAMQNEKQGSGSKTYGVDHVTARDGLNTVYTNLHNNLRSKLGPFPPAEPAQ